MKINNKEETTYKTIGEAAKELFVFQRTPSSIDVRNNHTTDTVLIVNQKPVLLIQKFVKIYF